MPGNRKSIRLKDYDYTQQGAYFVTICGNNRKCMFGDVQNGKMVLNDAGRMVDKWWQKMPDKYNMIEIDEYQIMPNHMHAIITRVGAPLVGALKNTALNDNVIPDEKMVHPNIRAPIKGAPTAAAAAVVVEEAAGLGEIIGAFKSMSTNAYIRNVKNNNWPSFDKHLWQRNFYELVLCRANF